MTEMISDVLSWSLKLRKELVELCPIVGVEGEFAVLT